ncbi:hypothetical protein [Pseudomonas sp. NPDC099000]|uniref:hypothetical protein n=1 Tax=Pseudomonas sp. NPDC099000 TaxID=3364488 RepID=UPI00383A452B
MEELKAMIITGSMVKTLLVDTSLPLLPRVTIPPRPDYKVGEIIRVFMGNVLVGTHAYRSGDFGPIVFPLNKEALVQVSGNVPCSYDIEHLDGEKSSSESGRLAVQIYDGVTTQVLEGPSTSL